MRAEKMVSASEPPNKEAVEMQTTTAPPVLGLLARQLLRKTNVDDATTITTVEERDAAQERDSTRPSTTVEERDAAKERDHTTTSTTAEEMSAAKEEDQKMTSMPAED